MKNLILSIERFFGGGIWRVDTSKLNRYQRWGLSLLKRIYLAIDLYISDNISGHASALTYSSIFATVPILAIVFAIGRGFGYGALVEEKIRENLSMNQSFADTILNFINSYLEHTQSGIFIGVGLLLLLYTIIQLTSNIEYSFNTIWQVKKPRSVYRRITDYVSVFLLLPILIVVTSGLSIFMVTIAKSLPDYMLLNSTVKLIISLSPYILNGLMFTGLYMYMPNTNVRFTASVVPGFIIGILFQFLQYLYIHSQIWVSSYNAIYGSFAALPMFMLWVQISWMICLFGAELSYANQNLENYNYANDISRLSRRYHDFLLILVLSKICKRFEKGMIPYTAHGLSAEHQMPIRLVNELLFELTEIKLVIEVNEDRTKPIYFTPAEDINRMTVGYVMARLERNGRENIKIDMQDFKQHWKTMNELKTRHQTQDLSMLVKDL